MKARFRINLKDSWDFEAKTLKECVSFLKENETVFNSFEHRIEQINPITKEVEQDINAKLLLRIFKETKERGDKLPLFISDIKSYLV